MSSIPTSATERERYVRQLVAHRKPLDISAEYAAPICVEFGNVVPVFRKSKFRRTRRSLRRQTELVTLVPVAFAPMLTQVRRNIQGFIAEHSVMVIRAQLYVDDIGNLYRREYGGDENALSVKRCAISQLSDQDIQHLEIGVQGDGNAIYQQLVTIFDQMMGNDD